MEIKVMKDILVNNNLIAEETANLFKDKGVFVLNLMASPGAGKTSFILKTIDELISSFNIAVIEGDIASKIDAEKIKEKGIPAVQINTGGACHLDANMIKNSLEFLDFDKIDLLIIENVGNLVCPIEFKMGENLKVVSVSIPEGDDKPLKYPA
ncbi:MAG: hydrogenase nickel incorporation protein HypB, partial [Candidatus Subteraquimicrobiales bacterium]|nr:hydrogenase nickel incorporation protein HypB [Candidatus Subteraquimicrobiales bacterium]